MKSIKLGILVRSIMEIKTHGIMIKLNLHKILLLIFFGINLTFYAQPWVKNNAVWKYHFQEQGLSNAEGIFETIKTGNVIKLGKLCDELITKRINYSFNGSNWNPQDTVLIDTNYTFKSISGDTIFWYENLEFKILYDFSKNIGEGWLLSVDTATTVGNCNDSSMSNILQKEIIDIGGNLYRKLFVDGENNSQKYRLRGEFNERFGAYGCCLTEILESYIFPTREINCWNNFANDINFTFLCFQDDSLTYDLNCDYYTVGISEVSNKIKISPNPFESKLAIYGLDFPCKIVLLSLSGNMIMEFNSIQNFNSTSFEFLTSGFYWIEIFDEENQLYRYKIIKN